MVMHIMVIELTGLNENKDCTSYGGSLGSKKLNSIIRENLDAFTTISSDTFNW